MFLRTPTLRSGGLKLSYNRYGKSGYILMLSNQFPIGGWFFYIYTL
ncbi:hypothetical protein KIS4809_3847 [Bacillus sp. ZZV12-4809]|nr:hypothetical protein KIS4809_3847 [Bacillus sp. ZZV12-4809]